MDAPAKQHLIDPEICIRCYTCEMNCPIEAITHNDDNVVVDFDICNFCMDCIPVCPTGSIDEWRVVNEPYSLEEQYEWMELPEQEEIEVYCTSFRPMKTAFAEKPDRVLMKLIVSKASRQVLGCHIVADGAGELIQMVGIAVKAGLTKEDFDRTVAVHPTMSEELVTMREPMRTA